MGHGSPFDQDRSTEDVGVGHPHPGATGGDSNRPQTVAAQHVGGQCSRERRSGDVQAVPAVTGEGVPGDDGGAVLDVEPGVAAAADAGSGDGGCPGAVENPDSDSQAVGHGAVLQGQEPRSGLVQCAEIAVGVVGGAADVGAEGVADPAVVQRRRATVQDVDPPPPSGCGERGSGVAVGVAAGAVVAVVGKGDRRSGGSHGVEGPVDIQVGMFGKLHHPAGGEREGDATGDGNGAEEVMDPVADPGGLSGHGPPFDPDRTAEGVGIGHHHPGTVGGDSHRACTVAVQQVGGYRGGERRTGDVQTVLAVAGERVPRDVRGAVLDVEPGSAATADAVAGEGDAATGILQEHAMAAATADAVSGDGMGPCTIENPEPRCGAVGNGAVLQGQEPRAGFVHRAEIAIGVVGGAADEGAVSVADPAVVQRRRATVQDVDPPPPPGCGERGAGVSVGVAAGAVVTIVGKGDRGSGSCHCVEDSVNVQIGMLGKFHHDAWRYGEGDAGIDGNRASYQVGTVGRTPCRIAADCPVYFSGGVCGRRREEKHAHCGHQTD